jgi:NAD-dependent deacetylase
MEQEQLDAAKNIIQSSNNIVAFTGAGISTESGIPDFRSPGGLWEKFDPNIYANFKVFKKDPSKYWELEREVTKLVEPAKPNPAHYALVTLEKQHKLKAIVTQNIDMLHQRAGSAVPIYELHGSPITAKCLKCNQKYSRAELLNKMNSESIPKCNICKGLIKPNVVLFFEELPSDAVYGAITAVQNCDCLLMIGSSLLVAPANQVPFFAKESGAKIIFINYEPTLFDEIADVCLVGKAGDILPKIVA